MKPETDGSQEAIVWMADGWRLTDLSLNGPNEFLSSHLSAVCRQLAVTLLTTRCQLAAAQANVVSPSRGIGRWKIAHRKSSQSSNLQAFQSPPRLRSSVSPMLREGETQSADSPPDNSYAEGLVILRNRW
jgi:hypothetical protein